MSAPAVTRVDGSESSAPAFLPGIPHPLPKGERVLWHGAPAARLLARHTFHQRAIALYFAVLIAAWGLYASADGDAASLLPALAGRVALAVVVLVIAEGLARAVAATTQYTLTDKRLVLRIGIVLPMSINVPYTLIESIDLREFADRSGQIAIRLVRGQRIAYIALWPHCRAFAFAQPSPVLRGLRAPKEVGVLFADALRASISDVASASSSPDANARTRDVDSAGDVSVSIPQPPHARQSPQLTAV